MTGTSFRYITFTSDYGSSDEFAGVCHGVMKRIAPEVEIIDITHGISPQSVREGAMVLAQSVAYMPPAVHLAIVDPGVGSGRLPIAVLSKGGSCLVGPDNGLLPMAVERLGGSEDCRKIENLDLLLPNPSKTFQGRDIFAPAAAHLAKGVPINEVGSSVDFSSLVGLSMPEPRRHDDHFHGEILHVDRFGNLQMNLTSKELGDIGLAPGAVLEVRIEGHRKLVPYGETFSAVPDGELVVTEDSYRLLALSVNRGSAAQRFGATLGSFVILGPPGSGAAD